MGTIAAMALCLCAALFAPSPAVAEGGASSSPQATPLGRVTLSAERVAALELVVETAPPATAAAEEQAFGHVLDPLPFLESARACTVSDSAVTLARSEEARVTRLHAHDLNASTRDVEVARDALRRATVDAANARARRRAVWGDVATRDDFDALLADLAAGRSAIARIDLEPGQRVAGRALRSIVSAADGAELRGRVLGAAPSTDPLLQGEGLLVLLEGEPVPVSTSLRAIFATASPTAGVLVPASAVVWHDGIACAYIAVGKDVFERRALTRSSSIGDPWLVESGVAPGEQVVVSGAQQLLSAEILVAARGE